MGLLKSFYSKKIGAVGKGLLFDTGGYNIKTGMMELMKFDCGGSVSTIMICRFDSTGSCHISYTNISWY